MRVNTQITITAGTPVNLLTGLTTAYTGPPVYASRVFIQMKHGGTGLGYVMDGIYQRVPSASAASDLTAELSPASSTAPGGSYEDWDKAMDRGGVDISQIWIDGSHSTDVVLASYVPKD